MVPSTPRCPATSAYRSTRRLSDGNLMGKRYVDEAGAEVLVTKAGAGTLRIGETPDAQGSQAAARQRLIRSAGEATPPAHPLRRRSHLCLRAHGRRGGGDRRVARRPQRRHIGHMSSRSVVVSVVGTVTVAAGAVSSAPTLRPWVGAGLTAPYRRTAAHGHQDDAATIRDHGRSVGPGRGNPLVPLNLNAGASAVHS